MVLIYLIWCVQMTSSSTCTTTAIFKQLSAIPTALLLSTASYNSNINLQLSQSLQTPVQHLESQSTISVLNSHANHFLLSSQDGRNLLKNERDSTSFISFKRMNEIKRESSKNRALLPWSSESKALYKTIPLDKRLVNEMLAGAFGEICKDASLHWVDTLKTRRQAKKKNDYVSKDFDNKNLVLSIKDLYRGFPIVLLSSLPQGATFFLIKTWLNDVLSVAYPEFPVFLNDILSIMAGVVGYWVFRTPAEVIKTKIQTEQDPSVAICVQNIVDKNELNGLWKLYSVMLSLDIPMQAINFLLFGYASDLMTNVGIEMTIFTRLLLGIFCGMVAAGLTCPLDVSKTRVIARMKQNTENHVLGNTNAFVEVVRIAKEEGFSSVFLGLQQRLLYTGLANGIRLAAYGTLRMNLMMGILDKA